MNANIDGSIGSNDTAVNPASIAAPSLPRGNTWNRSGSRVSASIATAMRPTSVSVDVGVRTSWYAGRPATLAVPSTVTSAYGATASSARCARSRRSASRTAAAGALASHSVVPGTPARWIADMSDESQNHASCRSTTTSCSANGRRCATRAPSRERQILYVWSPATRLTAPMSPPPLPPLTPAGICGMPRSTWVSTSPEIVNGRASAPERGREQLVTARWTGDRASDPRGRSRRPAPPRPARR